MFLVIQINALGKTKSNEKWFVQNESFEMVEQFSYLGIHNF